MEEQKTYKPIAPVNIGVNKDTINDFARKYNLEIEQVYNILNHYRQRKVTFSKDGDYWNITESGASLSVAHNGNIVYCVYRIDDDVEQQVIAGVKRDDTNIILESVEAFDGYMLFLSDDSQHGLGDNLTEEEIRIIKTHADRAEEANTAAQNAANVAGEAKDTAEYWGKIASGSVPYVTPQMFGAKGDGVADDTNSMLQFFSAEQSLKIIPDGIYNVRVPKSDKLYTFENIDGLRIECTPNAKIVNVGELGNRAAQTFISFEHCKNIQVTLNYKGCYNKTVEQIEAEEIGADENKTLGYYGDNAIKLIDCENVDIHINATNLESCVRLGDYMQQSNHCNNINVIGTCYICGYFVAAYGAKNLNVKCVTDIVHRSVYLAGVVGFNIDCVSGREFVVNTDILLTNEYNDGVQTGCKNGVITYQDAYAHTYASEMGCVGFIAQYFNNDVMEFNNVKVNIVQKMNTTASVQILHTQNALTSKCYLHDVSISVVDNRDIVGSNILFRTNTTDNDDIEISVVNTDSANRFNFVSKGIVNLVNSKIRDAYMFDNLKTILVLKDNSILVNATKYKSICDNLSVAYSTANYNFKHDGFQATSFTLPFAYGAGKSSNIFLNDSLKYPKIIKVYPLSHIVDGMTFNVEFIDGTGATKQTLNGLTLCAETISAIYTPNFDDITRIKFTFDGEAEVTNFVCVLSY